MIREKQPRKEIIIDLTGPNGDAFALIGIAQNFGKQLGWDKVKIQELIDEMIGGDYQHLLQVFDREFGSFVILEQ